MPKPDRYPRTRVAVVAFVVGAVLAGGPFAWQLARAESPAPKASHPLELTSATVAKPAGFSKLAKKVKPAVVNISTTAMVPGHSQVPLPDFPPGSPFNDLFRKFFQGQFGNMDNSGPPQEAHALGSGFIIDPEGYIVTNNHVIEHATKIMVTLDNGKSYPAKLKGHDKKSDLALLKIDAKKPLPYVAFGDSDAAEVGDWVIAVGNPFGLGGTVTAGIVSARGRNIDGNPYADYLQVDAPINPGNSGGPLFDQSGHVIGIDTAIYTPNGGNIGIGFAIPSRTAEKVINQLRENGKVERGWLGIAMQPVTPMLAKAIGLAKAKGVIVASVTPKSPADKAGLQQGDVMVAVNGKDIATPRDLAIAVADMKAGSKASFRIIRKGKTRTLTATIGTNPEAQKKAAENDQSPDENRPVGLALAPLTDDVRAQLGLDEDVRGAVVARVMARSPAAKSGIQPGDVIVKVGDEAVVSPKEAATRIHAAERKNKEAVALLVMRQGATYYLALPLKNEASQSDNSAQPTSFGRRE